MAIVTSFEAKTRFGELLDRVANGEEIVITRHEKPVARIVPEGRRSLRELSESVDAILRLRSRIAARARTRARLTDEEARAAIAEGRK